MPNQRVFYPMKRLGIAGEGETSSGNSTLAFTQVTGAQSAGVSTTFNLEQVFELGMLPVYSHVEGLPDVGVDVERVLDGHCPLYLLATGLTTGSAVRGGAQSRSTGANRKPPTEDSLVGKQDVVCNILIMIYSETEAFAGAGVADATPTSKVLMEDMQVTSVSYNFGVDGNSTESISFAGNHKDYTPSQTLTWTSDKYIKSGQLDVPSTTTAFGIVQRQDLKFGNSSGDCKLPYDIAGLAQYSHGGTDYPYGYNGTDGTDMIIPIQSISVSASLARETITQLGEKSPYARPLAFPVEVTTEISVIAGAEGAQGVDALPEQDNTKDMQIEIYTKTGLSIKLGSKNRLTSVNVSGGDASGGNDSITYSYVTYNEFEVDHTNNVYTS